MSQEDRDTLRTCEACEGEGCPWCDNGLQSRIQSARWNEFRGKMQHISNTYSFLQAIVLDVLDRLHADGSVLAGVLETEGRDLFALWQSADPSNGGREAVTEGLKSFNKRALDYLQAR